MTTAIARRSTGKLAGYAPGRLRRSSDRDHEVISDFRARHPEYARLGDIEIATLATTYRDTTREGEIDALVDAGVPSDWHRDDDFEEDFS